MEKEAGYHIVGGGDWHGIWGGCGNSLSKNKGRRRMNIIHIYGAIMGGIIGMIVGAIIKKGKGAVIGVIAGAIIGAIGFFLFWKAAVVPPGY